MGAVVSLAAALDRNGNAQILRVAEDDMFAGGDLVKLAFRNGHVATEAVGSGSSVAFQTGSIKENVDGTYSGVNFTVTALDDPLVTGSGGRCVFPVNGTKVGIRVRHSTSAPDLDVVVDGVAYAFSTATPFMSNGGVWTTSFTDGEHAYLVVEGLADREHTVEVVVTANANGGGTKSVLVYGYVASRDAGYSEPWRTGQLVAVTQLGVTLAGFFGSTLSAGHYPREMTRVLVTNTDASARQVNVQYNGVAVWEDVLAATGTTGSSKEIPITPTTVDSGYWTAKASAHGVVKLAVFGKG